MPRQTRLSDILAATERTRDADHERISKILHDETGGQLMVVATQLELLRMDGVQGLDPVMAALELAFDSVRTLSRRVHPKIVERIGLAEALKDLGHTGKQRFSGAFRTNVDTKASGSVELYRIAEELIDNAIRHSGARTIELVLTSTGELIVRDDGCGFDPKITKEKVPAGLGLLRVRLWGEKAHLRVRIRSGPESGTIFKVT